MTLLEVNNLKKIYSSRFGGASVQALSNVTFSVEQGEYLAIMGESGSGKSTAARCVMNLVQPRAGQIFYQGIDITNPRQFAAN